METSATSPAKILDLLTLGAELSKCKLANAAEVTDPPEPTPTYVLTPDLKAAAAQLNPSRFRTIKALKWAALRQPLTGQQKLEQQLALMFMLLFMADSVQDGVQASIGDLFQSLGGDRFVFQDEGAGLKYEVSNDLLAIHPLSERQEYCSEGETGLADMRGKPLSAFSFLPHVRSVDIHQASFEERASEIIKWRVDQNDSVEKRVTVSNIDFFQHQDLMETLPQGAVLTVEGGKDTDIAVKGTNYTISYDSENNVWKLTPEAPSFHESRNAPNIDLIKAFAEAGLISFLDLKGVFFNKVSLSAAKFAGAQLQNALLLQARFNFAGLRRVNLSGANLMHANFSDADVRDANFRGANLVGADFSNADLRGTKFDSLRDILRGQFYKVGAQSLRMGIPPRVPIKLCDLKLSSEALERLFAFLSAAEVPFADYVNLKMLNLIGFDLSGANLEEIDLSGAKLDGSNLEGANLKKAKLNSAFFIGANLKGVNLEDANLTCANLKKADLTDAILSKADASSVELGLANLTRATLTGVTGIDHDNCMGVVYEISGHTLSMGFPPDQPISIEEKALSPLDNENLSFFTVGKRDDYLSVKGTSQSDKQAQDDVLVTSGGMRTTSLTNVLSNLLDQIVDFLWSQLRTLGLI